MSRIVLARPVPSVLFEKKTPQKDEVSLDRRGGGGIQGQAHNTSAEMRVGRAGGRRKQDDSGQQQQ